MEHDYSMTSCQSMNSASKRAMPPTPDKIPTSKKNKTGEGKEKHGDIAVHEKILEAVNNLAGRFDVQEKKMEELSSKMVENCNLVAVLREEVNEYKSSTVELERHVVKLKEEMQKLSDKCNEQERYKRRWNLRLKGLKEKENENVKAAVISLLKKIAPGVPWSMDDMVNSVHRIGKWERNRTRQVIIQFVKRECRNEIWRLSKDSEACNQANVRFAEDLTKEDRATRELLWPRIKEAREQKKRAYFRGPLAFIDDVQIFP